MDFVALGLEGGGEFGVVGWGVPGAVEYDDDRVGIGHFVSGY